MGWLYRFHLKRALRDRGDMFWSLIFPLVLATLFYASFGSGKDLEQMSTIPIGVVKMADADMSFDTFLDSDADGNERRGSGSGIARQNDPGVLYFHGRAIPDGGRYRYGGKHFRRTARWISAECKAASTGC